MNPKCIMVNKERRGWTHSYILVLLIHENWDITTCHYCSKLTFADIGMEAGEYLITTRLQLPVHLFSPYYTEWNIFVHGFIFVQKIRLFVIFQKVVSD